jgi:hypothetical protein
MPPNSQQLAIGCAIRTGSADRIRRAPNGVTSAKVGFETITFGGVTFTTIPVRIAKTRTSGAPWESTSGLDRRIQSTV